MLVFLFQYDSLFYPNMMQISVWNRSLELTLGYLIFLNSANKTIVKTVLDTNTICNFFIVLY